MLYYDTGLNTLDILVKPRGYRILSKIPRIPANILENVIVTFGSLQNIIKASPSKLESVDGIGKVRANNINESLKSIKNSFYVMEI